MLVAAVVSKLACIRAAHLHTPQGLCNVPSQANIEHEHGNFLSDVTISIENKWVPYLTCLTQRIRFLAAALSPPQRWSLSRPPPPSQFPRSSPPACLSPLTSLHPFLNMSSLCSALTHPLARPRPAPSVDAQSAPSFQVCLCCSPPPACPS